MQRKKGNKNGKAGCVYNCKSHLSNQATSRRVPFKKNQELLCQTKCLFWGIIKIQNKTNLRPRNRLPFKVPPSQSPRSSEFGLLKVWNLHIIFNIFIWSMNWRSLNFPQKKFQEPISLSHFKMLNDFPPSVKIWKLYIINDWSHILHGKKEIWKTSSFLVKMLSQYNFKFGQQREIILDK